MRRIRTCWNMRERDRVNNGDTTERQWTKEAGHRRRSRDRLTASERSLAVRRLIAFKRFWAIAGRHGPLWLTYIHFFDLTKCLGIVVL
jgi:hypothetical protein